MHPPFDLTSKIALVTGAAQGIGRGIAGALAACGADVVINDLAASEAAYSLASSIRDSGRRAWVIPADVACEHDVERLFETIIAECGALDILVNNAGISRAQDIFETTIEDWRQVIDTNLTSCFLCSRLAMRSMRDRGTPGRIVNITSVVAHRGALHGHVHYAASKSALLGVTMTLARTGAPLGINVNAVAPGLIDTPLLRRTHGDDGVETLAATVPLGLGSPDDVGHAVAFLCSPAARYITGATLDVNGGLHFR